MPEAKIDAMLSPGYLDGLAGLPMSEIRARRAAANEVETGLSYLRRLVQGRLDIVAAERQRRDAGGAPLDVETLVERLPSILGEHVHAPGPGRLPTLLAPGELDPQLAGRLDEILPANRLAALAELDDAELAAALAELDVYERSVSGKRRALHEVLDGLQEEIVRRYRTGEATVDSLIP